MLRLQRRNAVTKRRRAAARRSELNKHVQRLAGIGIFKQLRREKINIAAIVWHGMKMVHCQINLMLRQCQRVRLRMKSVMVEPRLLLPDAVKGFQACGSKRSAKDSKPPTDPRLLTATFA